MTNSTRPFWFVFDVSNEFLRVSPAATEYVEACKGRIAARIGAVGPRGGLYRLVTPPDYWRESREGPASFYRDVRAFATRRQGRYVRPDRIRADTIVGDTVHFDSLTVPVVEGRAILPSGVTVETPMPFLTFPVLVP